MSLTQYPQSLARLIDALRLLPGVGARSAERFAFQMLNWPPHRLREMGELITALPQSIKKCAECGCLIDDAACSFCTPSRQESKMLCVVASPRDVYSLDSTGEFTGLFHVIENLLSPMDGFGPAQLNLETLKKRVMDCGIEEVVVAFDSTLEGDATALFIKEELAPLQVSVSRLGFGLPVGSSLDYVDGGTLTRAFQGRSTV